MQRMVFLIFIDANLQCVYVENKPFASIYHVNIHSVEYTYQQYTLVNEKLLISKMRYQNLCNTMMTGGRPAN